MPGKKKHTKPPAGSVTLIVGPGGEGLRSHVPGEVRGPVVTVQPVPLDGVTQLVLADPALTRSAAMAWLAHADSAGMAVWIRAELLPELATAGIRPQRIGTTSFYRFQGLRIKSGHGMIEVISPFAALLALPLALPVLALLALRVWLTDGRPVVFAQKRIGRQGRRFTMYKFRTMQQDRARRTRQVTDSGERLRRHGLDELPQIVNLLFGRMALIGPRPLPVDEHPRGNGIGAWMTTRERVMPGLTGLYQVCPGRRNLGLAEMCVLDAYWIHNRSLRLNAWILLRTVVAMFKGWGRASAATSR
jgi:lipopolysaccharide/colanic/teichoic acid biosynthesis glycosyltransferase